MAIVTFVSVSLSRENLRGLRENLKHKIRPIEESIKASTPRRALKGVKVCSFCDYKCKINSHMKRHLCSHLFGTVQVQKNLEEWKEFEKSTPLNNEGTGWDVTNEILLRATERIGDTNSKKQNIPNTPWASSKNKTIYSKKLKKDVVKMKVIHFCPFCKSVSRDITDLERHITRHFITGKVLKRRITKNPSLYQEVKNKIGITEHVHGTAQPNYHLVTGKSFSEALIIASVNPQYDKRLFIEFRKKYKFTTCCVQKLFFVLTFKTIFVHNIL